MYLKKLFVNPLEQNIYILVKSLLILGFGDVFKKNLYKDYIKLSNVHFIFYTMPKLIFLSTRLANCETSLCIVIYN